MQRSTSPTIDLVPENLLIDSVARGVCNGLEVAVKKIPRQLLPIEDDITKRLTQLDHENVLKIFAVDDDGTRFSPSGSTTGYFFVPGGMYRYVAMALCEATLEDYCEGKYVGPMPDDLTALNQIANGLKYIHSKGLVHGNIKPTNILISTERPIQLKLSDFGLMEPVSRQGILGSTVEKKCNNPFNRSRYWIPFELMEQLLNGDTNSPIQATLSSDMFSTGCLFFYFLTRGIHLYGPPSFIVRNILEGNLVNLTQLPKDHFAAPIIVKMVAKQPEDRINIKQVVDEIENNSSDRLKVPGAKDTNLETTLQNESQTIRRSIFSMKWSSREGVKAFRGNFSEVSEAYYAGVKVAVKEIENACVNRNFRDEVENIMKLLDHPNVLKLYSVVHMPQCKRFIIELCSATLKQYGSGGYKGPIPSVKVGLYQMACGLDYIHSQQLIHRNIKPSNVLISGTNPVLLKWSDFGLGIATDDPGSYTPNAPMGTYDWMAPEILREVMRTEKSSESNPAAIATTFSDIFSAGCVFFFFLKSPLHPFGHEAQIRVNILEGNPLNLESIDMGIAFDLILGMINPKPEERITLGNAMEMIKTFSTTDDLRKPKIKTSQSCIKQANELAYGEKELIGQGSFGPFFCDSFQYRTVAVLRVARSQFAEIVEQEEFKWYSIDHENVAEFFAKESNTSFRFYALESYKMSLDELYGDNYMEGSCFLKIPSDHHILLQLASGLDYIHTSGLVHCNINPKNVLFVSGNRVKWANQLGLKMEMTPEMLEWTAPEILTRKDNFYYRHCDTFSDMFSAGCVFFFFLSKGVHLFAGEIGTNEIVKNILQSKKMYLKVLANELWIIELIDDLTEHDRKLRPCAREVVKILTSYKSKLSTQDKEILSVRYFSEIRSSSPCIDELHKLSSKIQGTAQSVGENLYGIKRVVGKTVMRYPNPSGIDSYGNNPALLYVFEGEKVCVLLGELDILNQGILNHPNVIKPYFKISSGLVVQYYNASLDQLFLSDDDPKKYRGPMPTDEQVLFQLASGLDYMHSKDIIHRNIRPESILISASTKGLQMKISGFNFSVFYSSTNISQPNMSEWESRGMPNWASPEDKLLITKFTETTNHWNRVENQIIAPKSRFVHCDTFSFGCVFLYFLLGGIHPFGSINLVIPTNIARGNPVNLKELPENHFTRPIVTQMIEINPEKTIALSQIINYLEVNGYLKTRNRLSNNYYGNLNLVHSGPLSSVYKVTLQDDIPMAVKRIPLDASSSLVEFTSKVFNELKAIQHPNILKMFEFDHDKLYRYFGMEFCEESLDQWFPSTKDGNLQFTSRPTKDENLGYEQFMSQLTSGLHYIHEKGFVHGSIKPSNIFITSTKDLLQGPQIKLSSDFWITRENQMESLNSTPIWLAPELLESLMQHSSGQITVVQYTKASDIFAVGNAFFYYWSRGQNLFWKASGVTSGNTANLTSGVTSENMTNIMSGNQVNLLEFTPTYPVQQQQIDQIKGVIRWMTQKDPKQRPASLQEIVEHLNFFKPFPPPAGQLQEIEIPLVGNNQQSNQQPASPTKIQYSKDHVLGISADGLSSVFLGMSVKTTDRRSPDWNYGQLVPVAVKRMATVGDELRKGEILLKTVNQERRERAKIFMNLNHANVVKLYTFAKNSDFTVLALEKCRTSLSEYFRKPLFYRDFIKMPSNQDVLVQMAKGLDYIHSQNLIYCDVKPENVLISETNPAVIKWADFGISRAVIAGTNYFDPSKFTGTERWLPNEIIITSESNRLFNFYIVFGSQKCDIFALGCIFFFFLLSGVHPFGDDANVQDNIKNDNPVNIDRLSSEHFAFTAIKRMITKNILIRPKLSDVINCLEKGTHLD